MMMTGAVTTALFSLLLTRTLTLTEAERAALANAPQVRQARAATAAGEARTEQARAPALPQVKLEIEYQRTTGNRAQRPGRVTVPGNPSSVGLTRTTPINTFDTYNSYAAAVDGSFVLWDFGQTLDRWRAAEARAAALGDTERAVALQTQLAVRAAFFRARAQKGLVEVARQTVAARERSLEQVRGFVQAGTRPEIDLAQVRAELASARVQLINAENGYALTRAALNQAMGVTGGTDYDVADDVLPPIDGEAAGTLDALVAEAVRERPEVRALDGQIRAQALAARAARGAYGPTLSLIAGGTDEGIQLRRGTQTVAGLERPYGGMAWNVFAGLNLTWPLFQGFLTRGQVREADAMLDGLRAQRDGLLQGIWLGVQTAQLGVRSAREALAAADEAQAAARERLRLAEGRYTAGVGNIIELDAAQLAATTAAAQRVGAEYSLAAARAELAVALGRR